MFLAVVVATLTSTATDILRQKDWRCKRGEGGVMADINEVILLSRVGCIKMKCILLRNRITVVISIRMSLRSGRK